MYKLYIISMYTENNILGLESPRAALHIGLSLDEAIGLGYKWLINNKPHSEGWGNYRVDASEQSEETINKINDYIILKKYNKEVNNESI